MPFMYLNKYYYYYYYYYKLASCSLTSLPYLWIITPCVEEPYFYVYLVLGGGATIHLYTVHCAVSITINH